VFYETLLKQRPESEMAREWCLQYGIFDEERAKKEYKAMEKRKASSKSPKREKSSSTSDKKKKKKVKKVLDDVEYDAGMDVGKSHWYFLVVSWLCVLVCLI